MSNNAHPCRNEPNEEDDPSGTLIVFETGGLTMPRWWLVTGSVPMSYVPITFCPWCGERLDASGGSVTRQRPDAGVGGSA